LIIFQSVDYLHSKGITHVLNLGEADPLGVAPIIDPLTLPGEQSTTVKYSKTLKNLFQTKKKLSKQQHLSNQQQSKIFLIKHNKKHKKIKNSDTKNQQNLLHLNYKVSTLLY
jgi:hypothetical protein